MLTTISYLLSRFAFVNAHFVFLYWIVFLLNDAVGLNKILGLEQNYQTKTGFYFNTVDSDLVLPANTCERINVSNLINNVLWFLVWWGQHSIMARTVFKKVTGLAGLFQLDRPLFAALSTIVWGATIWTWQPISNCARFDPLEVSAAQVVVLVPFWIVGTLFLLGFFYVLPDHVFGTARYLNKASSHGLILGFPYGLVRHPAAAFFLWIYISYPNYGTNHILLATLWIVFILVGTLVLEEGGLRGDKGEFGKAYEQYAAKTPAFFPTLASISQCVSNLGKSDEKKSE